MRVVSLLTHSPTLLQTAVGPSPLDSVYNAKLGGSEVGYRMAEAVQRSTGIKP